MGNDILRKCIQNFFIEYNHEKLDFKIENAKSDLR